MESSIIERIIVDEGYTHIRKLPDGTRVAIRKMLYTYGLFVGLDLMGYSHRYCYETKEEAVADLEIWNGEGHPPGLWIKCKGALIGDILNPRWSEKNE